MTAMIMLMLWGTLTEDQRHEFLVRLLAMEVRKDDNLVHSALVQTVEAALANEIPDDKILEKLMEVLEYGQS